MFTAYVSIYAAVLFNRIIGVACNQIREGKYMHNNWLSAHIHSFKNWFRHEGIHP